MESRQCTCTEQCFSVFLCCIQLEINSGYGQICRWNSPLRHKLFGEVRSMDPTVQKRDGNIVCLGGRKKVLNFMGPN